jgi:hypothetical protein
VPAWSGRACSGAGLDTLSASSGECHENIYTNICADEAGEKTTMTTPQDLPVLGLLTAR